MLQITHVLEKHILANKFSLGRTFFAFHFMKFTFEVNYNIVILHWKGYNEFTLEVNHREECWLGDYL